MKIKEKGWFWRLTWPFAHKNYTTIWDTIYYPKNHEPGARTVAHEMIHFRQQKKWGKWLLPAWIFCYLFVLPILWNPFRKKWEYEAYREGSGLSHFQTLDILQSYRYGWLI